MTAGLNWLPSLFTIAWSALQPLLATALVSQMLTEWAKLLWQGLNTGNVDLVNQLVQGLKYVCDASSDAALLFSKLSVSAVVLRRVFWLKCWAVDQTSKKAHVDLPFQGDCLFGAFTTSSRTTWMARVPEGPSGVQAFLRCT